MKNIQKDSISGAVIAKFEGFLTFEEHKELGFAVLEFAKKYNAKKLIIDTSEIKVIKQETQNWIQNIWFPKANTDGITYMAFIVPSDTFGRMSTKNVNQKAGNIEIQYFDKIANAKSWIKNPKTE